MPSWQQHWDSAVRSTKEDSPSKSALPLRSTGQSPGARERASRHMGHRTSRVLNEPSEPVWPQSRLWFDPYCRCLVDTAPRHRTTCNEAHPLVCTLSPLGLLWSRGFDKRDARWGRGVIQIGPQSRPDPTHSVIQRWSNVTYSIAGRVAEQLVSLDVGGASSSDSILVGYLR